MFASLFSAHRLCDLRASETQSPASLRNPNSGFRISAAFTLIEMLVVIAIIAVLVGLAFPVIGSALERAHRAEAKNTITQVTTAVNALFAEYGKYPLKSGATGDSEYGADNDELFNVLRGYASSGYQGSLNPRQIQFLQVRVAANQSQPRNGLGGGVYYDPWGSPYHIKMDGDYDGKVGNPYATGAGYDPIEQGCIAWALGKDQKGGSGDKSKGDAADDVISWQ